MLELYFSQPTTLRHLRRGPLTPVLDQWAVALKQAGYSHSAALRMLSIAGQFNRYLHRQEVTALASIDETMTQQFLEAECLPYGCYSLHSSSRSSSNASCSLIYNFVPISHEEQCEHFPR